ncbi:hypothetical protein HYH03_016534 [Edaphochlamys debaryana]|uniref:Transcription and mRNA export factor ENY2 n=1 Tax=Edaphochlamys debaryana TaxID=47281 RepID=A0A836BPU6_9CHLO|nr:hypothetical protein HYH03_016534 [Edaphochlamys debaryana]|eukprot:KAG2484706.1 hypothetical protein HYH03_016534 [Edaphochlamys debaryana]
MSHGVLKRPAQSSVDPVDELRLEEKIRHHLTTSGKRDDLKELLTARLAACGWRDDIKQRCREYVAKKGRDQVTTDDIVRAIRPEGRATVPDSVKAELLAEIKKFILSI